jgi:hypothetical protein
LQRVSMCDPPTRGWSQKGRAGFMSGAASMERHTKIEAI